MKNGLIFTNDKESILDSIGESKCVLCNNKETQRIELGKEILSSFSLVSEEKEKSEIPFPNLKN